MTGIQGVEKDAGNKESRQSEEEVNPNPSEGTDLAEEIHEARVRVRICPEQMQQQDHADGHASNAVQ